MPRGPFPVAFPAPKATENNYFPVPAAKKPLFPQQQRRLYLLFSHISTSWNTREAYRRENNDNISYLLCQYRW